MKTPTELAEERARAVVRDRGAGHEPLDWQEIAALLDRSDDNAKEDDCDCDKYTRGFAEGVEACRSALETVDL